MANAKKVPPKRTPGEYDALKGQAMKAFADGESTDSIYKRLGVGKSTVAGWRRWDYEGKERPSSKSSSATKKSAAKKSAARKGAKKAVSADAKGKLKEGPVAKKKGTKGQPRTWSAVATPRKKVEQVLALREKGVGTSQIAKKTGISHATIFRIINKQGRYSEGKAAPSGKKRKYTKRATKVGKKRTRRKYDPETLRSVLADYASGIDPGVTAKKYGLPGREAVRRMARRHDVEPGSGIVPGADLPPPGGPAIPQFDDMALLMQLAVRLGQDPALRASVAAFLENYD